jgi:quinol monooxygenase YgiN
MGVGMAYVVVGKWTTLPGKEEAVLNAIEKMVSPSRAEPGCLFYQPHRDPTNSRVFVFYEQYVDEEAYKAHAESVHFKEYAFGEAIPQLESRERQFYSTLDF